MQYMSRAGYDPQAAVTLQETFVRLSEQGEGDGGRLAQLFASHPPSAERVAKNRETLATLPQGGDLGRERYQAATATLRERQPAYEAYDDGRKALADDKPAEAERLAQQAARLVPGKRSSMPCSATSTCTRSATTTRSRTIATRSRATIDSSITTCRKAWRIARFASGTWRAPSSRTA